MKSPFSLILTSLGLCLFTATASAETKTYKLDGMSCGGCVKSVKMKVCQLPGVETCNVSVGEMTLTGAHLDDAAISAAVSSTGEFSVVEVVAEQNATPATPAAKKSPKKPGS